MEAPGLLYGELIDYSLIGRGVGPRSFTENYFQTIFSNRLFLWSDLGVSIEEDALVSIWLKSGQ